MDDILGWFTLALAIGAFCLLLFLGGCAHKKEFYENGQMKMEEYGILFSDGKEFSLIKVGK